MSDQISANDLKNLFQWLVIEYWYQAMTLVSYDKPGLVKTRPSAGYGSPGF